MRWLFRMVVATFATLSLLAPVIGFADQSAGDIWCGHDWKGRGLPARPAPAPPFCGESGPFGAEVACRLNQRPASAVSDGTCHIGRPTSSGAAGPAFDHVELRGLVRSQLHQADGVDEEVAFQFRPMFGWAAAGGRTIWNGGRALNDEKSFRDLLSTWELHYDDGACMESRDGSGCMHVEVNGWGACRPCNLGRMFTGTDFKLECPPDRQPCAYSTQNRPRSWTFQLPTWSECVPCGSPPALPTGVQPGGGVILKGCPSRGEDKRYCSYLPKCWGSHTGLVGLLPQVYWPFNPLFPPGSTCEDGLGQESDSDVDYISITGTLWVDTHGNFEIHPVDSIVMLPSTQITEAHPISDAASPPPGRQPCTTPCSCHKALCIPDDVSQEKCDEMCSSPRPVGPRLPPRRIEP